MKLHTVQLDQLLCLADPRIGIGYRFRIGVGRLDLYTPILGPVWDEYC